MIDRYRNAINAAARLLHALRREPERLSLLLDLQRLLIRRIRQCERNIQRLKEWVDRFNASLKQDRLPRDQARAVKKAISSTRARIKQYQHLIFIWKCFGDGIANIYLSKYSLKHAFYSVEDYAPKEAPGFLTGKKGFRLEWKIVRMAIDKGHPVLLCDITNVLRYGDVCLMSGADPFLLEVKSSKNRNDRIERQLKQLEELHNFFANDGADEFRGLPNVRRQAFVDEEINYTTELNKCIERSSKEGMAVISPEPGLNYLAIRTFKEELLDSVMNPSSVIFFLNDVKSSSGWMPYFPFTLSIEPEYIFDFVQGDVSLIVIVDLKVLKEHFKSCGYYAAMIDDGVSAIQISKRKGDLSEGVFRVSQHAFLRIPLELQSLKWFAAEMSRPFETAFDNPGTAQGFREIPADWYDVSDGLDDATA